MTAVEDLRQALKIERNATFLRLRGGYPIPLAGAIWWTLLGFAGYKLHPHNWILLAFVTSGTIFPLALLLARVAGIDFMRDRTAITDVLFPALTSMVLFWPVAIAAYWTYPQLVPLIMAVGMSAAWPVIGWTYNRTALFTAHAVVRAVICFILWNWFPTTRFTLLPLSVAFLYLATIAATFADAARSRSHDALD